jgi:ATP-binding cassette subfamily B protein
VSTGSVGPSPVGTDPVEAPAGWGRRLWQYVWRYRRNVIIAFGAALLATAVTTATPLIERQVVDKVIVARTSSLWPYALVLVLAGVLRFGLGFLRRYVGGRLALDVQYDLRDDVFRALQRLDGPGQDQLATGQVVSRASSDITLVQGLLAFLPNISGNALLFVSSLVVMAFLSPLLTLVALAVGPLLLLVAFRSRQTLFPATWDAQQQAGMLAGVVEEDVTGVRVVKGFGQETREIARLEEAARSLFASRLRAVRISSRYQPALQAIPAFGQLGVLAFGGYLAVHGRISLGTFLAFSTYLGELVAPTRILAGLLTVGQQARAGVERVLEIVDADQRVAERPDAEVLSDVRGEVVFDNVTFAYASSPRPVLQGVDVRIEPGETVAFVGGPGSGKSTLALLLTRFYDVSGGRVLIDGHDVRDLSLQSLRSRTGVVFEDSFLFSQRVFDNIAYGRPDASVEQVREAARAAEADGFIEALPKGYDTVVGEQGLTLSGGQRQRVALARALLTDPRILILDDATSAVDTETEAAIHATLHRVMAGRTTLLVAHRRSTLRLADRIVVLDRGRVLDTGTHEELQERCPLYRMLLSGPEGTVLEPEDPAAQQVSGITPELWQHEDEPVDGPVREGASGARPMGMGGGPVQSALAAVPATPELLARVATLPPALDVPDVGREDATAADLEFSLRRLLHPLRAPLGLVLLLVALDAAAGLVLPLLIRNGVDQGISKHVTTVLWSTTAVGIVVVLADWAVSIAQTRVAGRTGERLLYTLRLKTFAQLQRLGLDYYERELAGRIMTRMTTDVDALSTFLQTGLATAVVSALQFVGVLVVLLVLDIPLALVVLALMPVLIIATLSYRKHSGRAYTEARERISVVNASLQENLSGVRVTQAFNQQASTTARFRVVSDAYRQSRLRAQRYLATYFPFVEFLSELAAALVLAVGAERVHSGGVTTGGLIAFLLYLDLFFSPVQQLSQVFDGYQQAQVGLRRLSDLLRTPTTVPAAEHPRPVGRLTGEIRLTDVHFAYQGATTEALAGVSLNIAPGETVALVGETGAGKSTLVKLVARFYDPTGGSVSVDDQDLRTLDLTEYRQRLGVVPQEAFLFSGSVRDAIAYGRPDATDAEVERAARMVGAHDVVAGLPRGYRSPVGERGRGLSAGQRQLLALARAELVDPDILLLDEATASLDLATEAAVLRAMERLARRRTTLVIAHRLSTAQRADRVVVLGDGRILEVGPHAELLTHEGPYSALWTSFVGDDAARPRASRGPVPRGRG